METVTITMSRKTAEAVKQACEEYLRLRMGQFEDFCGKTMFAPTDRCSNMNSVRERMTRDWEEVTDDQGRKRDLCPECSKEYKKIIGGFLKKK